MRIAVIFVALTIILLSGCKKDDSSVNKPPEVEFLNPLPLFAAIPVNDTLNLLALATDADGEIKGVSFFIDSNLIATDNSEPWTSEIIFTEEKEVDLAVVAIDNKMQSSDAAMVHLVVYDPDKAKIDITFSPEYHKKENDPVYIKVNSFSPLGKIIKTQIYLNGTLIASDTNSYTICKVDSVAVGLHEVYAVVEDVSGKISTSETAKFLVAENKPPVVEVSTINSYYLIPGSVLYIDVEAEDYDGAVDSAYLYLNDSLVKKFIDTEWMSANIPVYTPGNYKIKACAWDTDGALAESNEETVYVNEGFLPEGPVTGVLSGSPDDIFFALDQSVNHLLLLHPFSGQHQVIELPCYQPIAMDYSASAEKLFIVYKYDGVLTIYDQNSGEIENKIFSGTANALSVTADVLHNRAYIESDEGIHVVDINSGNELYRILNLEYDSYVIDTENQWLFTIKQDHTIIKKYSLGNSGIELLQSRSFETFRSKRLRLNQQKNYIIALSSDYSNVYHLAISTMNINEDVGQFNNIKDRESLTFSNDGETMVSIDPTEKKLHLHSAETFEIQKSVSIKYGDNAKMAINNSRTKAVIYSHSIHQADYRVLYYKLN